MQNWEEKSEESRSNFSRLSSLPINGWYWSSTHTHSGKLDIYIENGVYVKFEKYMQYIREKVGIKFKYKWSDLASPYDF